MDPVILLNKPFGVQCKFTDAQGRLTLADFVQSPDYYAAGRLDSDSEGLVVLTRQGFVQHRISHPSAKLSKTYWAQVEGDPTDADLDPLRRGVHLADGPTRPAEVSLLENPQLWERIPPIRVRATIPDRWLQLVLREGRNRQVRRMTAHIGFPTLRLVRWSIGPWTLGTLLPGQWRFSSPQEWQHVLFPPNSR